MNVLDLFSGIGGFSLGLERAGMTTVAFCEIEPFPRSVLKKHWPNVPVYPDVRSLNAETLKKDKVPKIDVICGGFPCQDISLAGKGAGLKGERSGLWSEFRRLIEEIRPRYAIIENVSALRSRGLDQVLGSLAAIGYDAEWHCIPASAIGAPHRRDRIWIIAYPCSEGRRQDLRSAYGDEGQDAWRTTQNLYIAGGDGAQRNVADASSTGLQGHWNLAERIGAQIASARGASWWAVEPNVGRVADGVPSRVDRLRCLGNAVVPQIPEMIGRAILCNRA